MAFQLLNFLKIDPHMAIKFRQALQSLVIRFCHYQRIKSDFILQLQEYFKFHFIKKKRE
jgi:hypothetical protein